MLPKVYVVVSFITSIEHFYWFRFTKCGFKYSDNHLVENRKSCRESGCILKTIWKIIEK